MDIRDALLLNEKIRAILMAITDEKLIGGKKVDWTEDVSAILQGFYGHEPIGLSEADIAKLMERCKKLDDDDIWHDDRRLAFVCGEITGIIDKNLSCRFRHLIRNKIIAIKARAVLDGGNLNRIAKMMKNGEMSGLQDELNLIGDAYGLKITVIIS